MPEVALEMYARIEEECKNIKLCGLMSIGAHTEDRAVVQKSFELTQNLFLQIKGAEVLSMGMSGDFELAIACGSNCVRLGSILFK